MNEGHPDRSLAIDRKNDLETQEKHLLSTGKTTLDTGKTPFRHRKNDLRHRKKRLLSRGKTTLNAGKTFFEHRKNDLRHRKTASYAQENRP